MNSIHLTKIQRYLQNNARPLDLSLYDFHFHGGSAQKVLDELQAYQNNDGGFGKALEPDLRLPQSTALATWVAFQIMNEVGVAADNELLQHGIQYLIDTYDTERSGWAIVRPEVDNYPHAPWWEYKAAMAGFGWGNPSAELLGFFIKYGSAETTIVNALTQKALARVHEVGPSQFHEVFNFKALYELAGEELRSQLHNPIERLILNSANTHPDDWNGYVATPLRFINSPSDPFAHLFSTDIINKNLDFLLRTMVNQDHWEPNWDWSGAYPDDWEIAKKEWSGQLTVKNLVTVKNFGIKVLRE